MRYVVLGCGAIGGTVAAGLARDGHDVMVCDADPAVVSAVRDNGLRITGPVEELTVRVPAVLPADLPEHLDGPVLVAVKAQHTRRAGESIAGRLTGSGFVVSLQNGLTAAVLAGVVGTERVVEAVVNFGADVLQPGVIMRGNRATFLLGELDGSVSERVEALAGDIGDASPAAGILGYTWGKEAYGATLFATAVSDLAIHEVFENQEFRPLLIAVATEVLRQAPVTPRPLDGFDPDDLAGSLDRLAEFNRQSAKSHTGIYRDLAVRHRTTEAAAILGPLEGFLIRKIEALIHAIERGERALSRANLELLCAYERLDRLGRPLNAVVSVADAPARAAAGPLAGRPVAVKDIIAVAGLPRRCGSPASDPNPSPADAPVVARLREAGAEVFATSQCLEYAAGFAHPEIGDTRNPRDPSKTSGGSSGGSAALVAAGVCELALGTDTGGSIRIPAAYCGVTGLKPTYDFVSATDVVALAPSCDHVGTLTATAADSAALLAAVTGRPAEPAVPGGRVLGVLTAQFEDPSVTAEVREALRAALRRLSEAGFELREISAGWLDDLRRWEGVLATLVAREAWQVHRLRDTSRYADGTRALLAAGSQVTAEQYELAAAERAELTAAVDASLAGVDALAGPTVGYCAPTEDPPFGTGDDSGEGRFTGPYNLTGHPAVSIPVPAPGLPVGLQLAAARGSDLALLALAGAAESALMQRTVR